MRILFVVPRSFNPKQMYREYPLGVGFIGTILRGLGNDVAVYDENAEGGDENRLFARIASFAPEVVGYSLITPNYPVFQRQMPRLRREHPEVRVIAGGLHATLFPEDVLADGADIVVLGEGERTTPLVLEALAAGRRPIGVEGVAWLQDGTIVRSARSGKGVALDDLPMVDRSLYDLSLYTHHSMVASRGCPFKCAFCCNYTGTILTKGVSIRPHQRVLDELQHLRDAHDAREVFFVDDIFLLKRSEALSFCRGAIERRIGVSWIGQMRVDTIDRELADLMVEAGCRRTYFGVESGSDEILRAARKGIDTNAVRKGLGAAKAAGMRVKTGWIFGLPGTLEQQYASIDFMRELRPHEISIHQLIPFPGTPYYERAADFGIRIDNPKDFESFCYGGLEGNVRFDYLAHAQLVRLFEDTARALEAEGYVASDVAGPSDEYVYTTPLHSRSMNVFRQPATAAASPQSTAC